MPADGPAPGRRAESGPRWLCVTPNGDGTTRVVFVASGHHPDSARVELSPDDAARQIGDDAVAEAGLDAEAMVRVLRVLPAYAPKAPPVWFAELRETTGRPPAVNLLAFTGAGQPSGVLVDEAALSDIDVATEDQLGAVRWYPATGEVDQVYVQPAWRRRSIATVLTLGASTLSMARGWPRLWGDGQRTEQGEALRNASVWRDRTATLVHVSPPMTPGEPGEP